MSYICIHCKDTRKLFDIKDLDPVEGYKMADRKIPCHHCSAAKSNGKMFGDDWISLAYILKYPKSQRTKEWREKLVAINTDGNYWKYLAKGYTYRPNAAAYTFDSAIGHTLHLKNDRYVTFHEHGVITNENHEFDPSGRRKIV